MVPMQMATQGLAHQMLANRPCNASQGQRAEGRTDDYHTFRVRTGVVKRIVKKVGAENREAHK